MAQKRSFARRAAKWAAAALAAAYLAAVTLPYVPHKAVSEEYKAAFAARSFTAQQAGSERAAYVTDNTDALLCRLHMIRTAQKQIVLSTFDFDADQAGADMVAALLEAAGRGVQVYVLVDGLSGFMDIQRKELFRVFASQPGVQLRIYNPVNLLAPWALQARLHDKYLIADDQVYLLGGRNTNDLFLGDYPTDERNADRELLVYCPEGAAGGSMAQLTDYFWQVWNSPAAKPFAPRPPKNAPQALQSLAQRSQTLRSAYPAAYRPWDWQAVTFETNCINLLANPIQAGNKEPWVWYSLCRLMENARQAIVYTPYIICGSEMYADLTALCAGGVQLQFITNHMAGGSNPWGGADYLNQKKRIWATGAQVYEYLGEHSCHTKALVIDDRLSVLGSYNFDMRSTYQDTELMLVVDSPTLNGLLRAEAARDMAQSRVMGPDGQYREGEAFTPRAMGAGRGLLYGLLRVVTLPIRRFL